jgi:hypothetical protein
MLRKERRFTLSLVIDKQGYLKVVKQHDLPNGVILKDGQWIGLDLKYHHVEPLCEHMFGTGHLIVHKFCAGCGIILTSCGCEGTTDHQGLCDQCYKKEKKYRKNQLKQRKNSMSICKSCGKPYLWWYSYQYSWSDHDEGTCPECTLPF